ncbi:MAG TPA: matrixin family metalloprotease [Bryobacteraceae bacterium]|nr:matrixin family metalloprotease [Bryobacteraceae bacterium]
MISGSPAPASGKCGSRRWEHPVAWRGAFQGGRYSFAPRAGRWGALLLILFGFCASPAAAATLLRYWIEPCPASSDACRPGDPQLAQWALDAWHKVSAGKLAFESTSVRDRAHIRILWTGGHEGLYGEARPIVVDGVRGAEVYVLPPPPGSYENDPLLRDTIVYLTCLHETGHALGLSHTTSFADIMYSFQYGGDIAEYFGRYRRRLTSRADIPKYSGTSEADRRRLIELLH